MKSSLNQNALLKKAITRDYTGMAFCTLLCSVLFTSSLVANPGAKDKWILKSERNGVKTVYRNGASGASTAYRWTVSNGFKSNDQNPNITKAHLNIRGDTDSPNEAILATTDNADNVSTTTDTPKVANQVAPAAQNITPAPDAASITPFYCCSSEGKRPATTTPTVADQVAATVIARNITPAPDAAVTPFYCCTSEGKRPATTMPTVADQVAPVQNLTLALDVALSTPYYCCTSEGKAAAIHRAVNVIQQTNPKDASLINPKVNLRAYPNPFRNKTAIAFTIPSTQDKLTLDVYSMSGKKLHRLFEGKANGGQSYTFEFDGTYLLSSNMYFIRLTTSKTVENLKIIMAK